jgi:hypothetical protein
MPPPFMQLLLLYAPLHLYVYICTSMHLCTPSLPPYVSQNGVLTLNVFGYVNALAIMIAVLIWARVLHKRLQHNLIYDPLTVLT